MINCHFVWPAVHMPERGRETRLVPVALSSFISIREVYYLWWTDILLSALSAAWSDLNFCLDTDISSTSDARSDDNR